QHLLGTFCVDHGFGLLFGRRWGRAIAGVAKVVGAAGDDEVGTGQAPRARTITCGAGSGGAGAGSPRHCAARIQTAGAKTAPHIADPIIFARRRGGAGPTRPFPLVRPAEKSASARACECGESWPTLLVSSTSSSARERCAPRSPASDRTKTATS